jgi:hypothetical protein
MNEDKTPTLGYAPIPPKPLKRRVLIAASVGAASIVVTVAGMSHFATRAQSGRPAGMGPAPNLVWQTQPAGGLPATQPAADLATLPAAETDIQPTAIAQ